MIDARLALALDGGGLSLPFDALVAVIAPPVEAELSPLSKEQVEIIEGFKPAHDEWLRRGYAARVVPGLEYSAIVVCLPRAKADARAMVALAMRLSNGPVIIDGQKTDGVDSILRDVRKRMTVSAPISKAHGKLFWCSEPDADAFQDWEQGPELTPGGFWTAPGVFSADAVDPASAMLVDALPDDLGKRVGDLGAGWGFLSAHILTREKVEAVHLIEANHMALECAKRNVSDPRAIFHWADASDWPAPAKLDTVVMNPPFHTRRKADPALGQMFVRAAAAVLSPQGHLWMVANRHLPYEDALTQYFAQSQEIGGDARFKLFHATRPLRNGKRRA